MVRRDRTSNDRVRRRLIAAVAVLAVLAIPALAWGQVPAPPEGEPLTARETEPVILTGAAFGEWSARAEASVKLPLTDLLGCNELQHAIQGGSRDDCTHNDHAEPELRSSTVPLPEGTPIERLLGYRWERGKWREIPFQVDEMFPRYLDNSASGFAWYSGHDRHTTYAFDREGFRFYGQDPDNPCLARPGPGEPVTTPDPIRGLDDDDEVAFMASDAGSAAPSGTPLPPGIESARAVPVHDPLTGETRFAYVMLAAPGGPRPGFDASTGYVRYARDANADIYERSQSSYDDYGNARRGIVCDAEGNVLRNPDGSPRIERRRPRDYATVTTPRYRFRYDGRWLMTRVQVSQGDDWSYGHDLVDRWKARAYQQDPSSKTPCCGYEEEDTNWGGSSTLMGERSGPVRTIRETWGADSGTNVVRREVFYREEVRQKSWLRVHPITPLDGIYAQWDFNAGVMTRYFNPQRPEGVPVDGSNDEAFGNFDDPCNRHYDGNDTSDVDQGYRTLYRALQLCFENAPDSFPPDDHRYHQSIDTTDPQFSGVNAAMSWSQTSGPSGTIVDRYQVDRVTEVTPGGAAQSLVATPYYRDDSCFDDGTGSDPGPRLRLRSPDEPRTWEGEPRRCWTPADGVPDGSPRFFQGSIATHGLHLLFIVDSDNGRLTVPTTEIVAEQRMVMLPGEREPRNVGERYGRGFEKPLVAAAGPAERGRVLVGPPTASDDDPGDPGGGNPGGGNPGGEPGGGGANPGGGAPGGGASGGGPAEGAAVTPRPGGRRRAGTPAARVAVARRTRALAGAFPVRCRVRHARACAVTAFAGRRAIGRGSAPARSGRARLVRVRLTPAGRRLLASSRRGLRVRIVARPVAARRGSPDVATTALRG